MTQQAARIYVTGVAGMIGSNAARALLEDGLTVVGVDNLWRGTRANIADLLSHRNFTFRHADLISDRDWYRDMGSADVLIHLADIVAGIGYVFSNEWSIFQRNVLINTSVARVVGEKGPGRLVYVGTACSYPQQMQRSVQSSKLSESDKFPADPESGYGWSKLVGEVELRLATKHTSTRLTVLDLHNVYGWPCTYRDATSQVIPSLIFKAINSADRRLSVWGDGKQGRAFLHVSDAVSALRLALSYSGGQPTFMIGPDRCTTIAEVASTIQAHPKIDVREIVFDVSKPIGDIGRFADSTLASRELGWTPKVDFRQGVHELIDRIIDDCE
jgi:nucleoside-diphosphate-sugar epimerase